MARPLSEQLGISVPLGETDTSPGYGAGDRPDLDRKYGPRRRSVSAAASALTDGVASAVGGAFGAGRGVTDSLSSVGTTRPRPSGRTIFGFMAFAMLFSIIAAELRNAEAIASPGVQGGVGLAARKGTPAEQPKSPLGGAVGIGLQPTEIFLGGTFATAVLVLMADTGETGRKLGVGLAGLTLVAAVVVNGGPVWTAASRLIGSKPTGTTGQTTPTGQTAGGSGSGGTGTTRATAQTGPTGQTTITLSN